MGGQKEGEEASFKGKGVREGEQGQKLGAAEEFKRRQGYSGTMMNPRTQRNISTPSCHQPQKEMAFFGNHGSEATGAQQRHLELNTGQDTPRCKQGIHVSYS